MADLRALAERFVSLSSEIESVRREMLICLSNGLDPDEASAPGQPASAKPNGRDPHPPPRQAKARQSAFAAKTAEQRLIAAMRDHPGASVDGLAKAAGANRSSTGERLRGLASRGVVTKDSGGHWRLVAEAARPTEASPT